MGGWIETQGGPRRSRPGARAIGGAPTRMPITLTSVVPGPDGVWVYGPEVPAGLRDEIRTVLRRDGAAGGERPLSIPRREVVIDPRVARDHGIRPGARLAVALLSPAQRRVRTARFQQYGTSTDAFVVEDLDGTDHRLADGASWAGLCDVDVIRRLQELPVDLFSSERVVRASLPHVDAPAFVGYEDELGLDRDPEPVAHGRDVPRSHVEVAPRGGITHWAFGVVADPAKRSADPFEVARAALYAVPGLARIFDAVGEGTYRVPLFRAGGIVKVAMPLELASRAPIHFDLSIRQALAGAGDDHAEWTGRPVALRVIDLFEAHMRNAFRRLEGEVPPPDATRAIDLDRLANDEPGEDDEWAGDR